MQESWISKLPVQLLAQILQHIDQAQRLQRCALVNSTWRQASILATRDVDLWLFSTKRELKSAALFMQLYGHAAAVSSLQAEGPFVEIQLPCQQLTALQKLSLKCLVVDWQDAAGSQEGRTPRLPAALSKLTCLEIVSCATGWSLPKTSLFENKWKLDITPLKDFSQLQHLHLSSPWGDDASMMRHCAAALRAILPVLQQLTHLELGNAYAVEEAVVGAQQLPRLQALVLRKCCCGTASLAALPPTLTCLELRMPEYGADLTFSPKSTPRLTQLKALKRLAISHARAFDLALLRSLRQLQQSCQRHKAACCSSRRAAAAHEPGSPQHIDRPSAPGPHMRAGRYASAAKQSRYCCAYGIQSLDVPGRQPGRCTAGAVH